MQSSNSNSNSNNNSNNSYNSSNSSKFCFELFVRNEWIVRER